MTALLLAAARRVATTALLAGIATIASSHSASAQGKPQDAVVVALLDEQHVAARNQWALADSAPVRIIRHKNGQQRNIILLRKSRATSGLLEEAIRALADARTKKGSVPEREHHLAVHSNAGAAVGQQTRDLFARLQHAAPADVRDFGLLPALTIRLPE
ncbi:MAG: hypothetical protein ABJE47_12510 [bacterium]